MSGEEVGGESVKGRPGLSGFILKILACLTMTADHIGAILFPGVLVLRAIGRVSFPLFAFLSAEGSRYSHRPVIRFLTVAALGLVCEIVYDVFSGHWYGNILLSLAAKVGARLRGHGACVEAVPVTIKDASLHSRSHQMILDSATDITQEIYRAACRLFEELWEGEPLRLLGISAGRIRDNKERQMNIFDGTDYEKLERLDRAVYQIRGRFGSASICRASFLEKKEESGRKTPRGEGREGKEREGKGREEHGERRGV